MPVDALQESTSFALRDFLLTQIVHLPIDSFHLLRLLIANASTFANYSNSTNGSHTPSDAKPTKPRLRLTDLARFEVMLKNWADKWDHGVIAVVKSRNYEGNVGSSLGARSELSVVGAQVTDKAGSRKRKRGEDGVGSGMCLSRPS